MLTIIPVSVILLGLLFYFVGTNKITRICDVAEIRPHSLFMYHGSFPAILAIVPPLILLGLWVVADDIVFNMML